MAMVKQRFWYNLWSPDGISLLLIGSGFIIVPYFRGLYFDADMMVVEQVLCLLLLITGLWKWVQYVRTSIPSNSLYQPHHVFIFALLIPYVIGLWTAVAPYDNWLQLFRYMAYGIAFFIVAEALSHKPWGNDFLQICIQISIGWTTLFAVAAALGHVTYKDAVLYGRLASVYQYPNTFGIILAVGIVGGLLLTLRREWWLQAVGGLFMLPMGYVFLLTLSRGAWLVFPIVYLLGMLLLPVRAQWAYLIHSIPLGAGVGILLFFLGTQLEGASARTVWIGLLVAMIVGAAGYPLLVRLLSGRLMTEGSASAIALRWRNLAAQLILPAVMTFLLFGALYALLNSPSVQEILPETIQKRVAQIDFEQYSVLSRQMFNQDALEIYRDYPVFGAGGGGWRALFQQYQDYPYWSTQSHNFFSQIIVETGTFGIILFVSVFLYYVWRGFRWYVVEVKTGQSVSRTYFMVILLGLLVHSAIDFNMSFGYVGILVFLALAGWQASKPDQPIGVQTRKTKLFSKWIHAITNEIPITKKHLQTVTFLILLLVAGWMVFPIHQYAQAGTLYKEARTLLQEGNVKEGLNRLEQIIRKSPYHYNYHLTYGSLLVSIGHQQQDHLLLQKGIEHIRQASELAPTQPQLLSQVAQHYRKVGMIEEAFQTIQQAMQMGPWDIGLYLPYMEMAYELGEHHLSKGNKVSASEVWEKGLSVFEQVALMRAEIYKLPKTLHKGRPFGETEELRLLAGKLHYRLGQFQQAYDTFSPLFESENEEIQQQAVLWSMAAQLQAGAPMEETAGYHVFMQHQDWSNELRQILMLEIVDKETL